MLVTCGVILLALALAAATLRGLSDAAVDTTVDWSERRPSSGTLVIIRHCGGAISRVGVEETAFGDRARSGC